MVQWLEGDMFASQYFGDVDALAMPFHMPFLFDFAHREVVGVFNFGQLYRIRPRRWSIYVVRPAPVTQTAMRPLFVVLGAKGVEGALLGAQVGLGRLSGRGLQGTVHALMPAILLRLTRIDAFGQHAKLQQPHAESTQTTDGDTGKRRSIVGAHHPGQTVLAKGSRSVGSSAGVSRAIKPVATQQEAAVVVGDGQWVADPFVPERKVPFEVRTPYIVGPADAGKRLRGRWRVMPPLTRLDQAVALEDFARGTHCGPRLLRIFASEPVANGQRPPIRIAVLQSYDRANLISASRPSLQERRRRASAQSRQPFAAKASQPLVAGRSTNFKAPAQLTHREFTTQPGINERLSLFHGTGLFPGHAAVLLAAHRTNL